ncbi:major capsid protein [uncultured Duncaniella sp.]|uniref:major capsid protein n=1 Tax=uncultured Duncaniella sp. TaxID=2768039 RepID=UPI00339D39AA
MPNPFGKDGGPVNSVPRNTFDLSFQNNLTLPFGALVPCFCKETLPGDSFRIDTTFGLRFMPTAFPLQTRIRADVHFFYVRNRNLWKD